MLLYTAGLEELQYDLQKWLHFAMRPLLATMAAIMAIGLVGGVLRLAMRAATSVTHCGTTVTKVAGIILRPLFTKDSSGN